MGTYNKRSTWIKAFQRYHLLSHDLCRKKFATYFFLMEFSGRLNCFKDQSKTRSQNWFSWSVSLKTFQKATWVRNFPLANVWLKMIIRFLSFNFWTEFYISRAFLLSFTTSSPLLTQPATSPYNLVAPQQVNYFVPNVSPRFTTPSVVTVFS